MMADLDDSFDVIPEHQELFISHADWMRRTYLTIGYRSAALKQLDEAILKAEKISHELATFDDQVGKLFQRGLSVQRAEQIRNAMELEAYHLVRNAFEAWIRSEGDWRKSRRNYDGAATQVHKRMSDLQERHGELVPDASHLLTAGNELTAQLFRSAEVRVRGADMSNVVQSSQQAASIPSALSRLDCARSAFTRLITTHFGDSPENVAAKDPWLARELMTIIPGLTHQIQTLVQLLPGVRVATSTVTAISNLYDVRKTDQQRTKLITVTRSLPTGDALTALHKIKEWQDNFVRDQKMAAAANATVAGTQLLGILVPGAHPAAALVSAANSVVQMMNALVDLGVQYRESQELRQYLRNTKEIDADIFAICPLVGAYYVLNVPFSVFSLHLVPFHSPTFFSDTEYLRESGEMKAVLQGAEKVLDASKYILVKDGKPFRSRESMRFEVKARLALANLKPSGGFSFFSKS
jgi:hypothetical protein